MNVVKVNIFDLSVVKAIVTLVGLPSTITPIYLLLNIDFPVYVVVILSIVGALVVLVTLAIQKVSLLNLELDQWCREFEPNLYVQHDGEVGYLNNVKNEYKKWLRANLFLPPASERKNMFSTLVSNHQSLNAKSLIRLGLMSLLRKPWYERIFK